MRKFIAIAVFLILSCAAFAQTDDALSAKLNEYVEALKAEPMDVQVQEVDFIISSCEDLKVREQVANELYSRYDKSKIMGSETVSIHIFDKWFADGQLNFSSDHDFLTAQITAEFNRQSLIGCTAPELELFDREGNRVVVDPAAQGRYSVIYFFDADCPKCSVESGELQALLCKYNFPVDVYLICTTSDMDKWDNYRFHIKAPRTRVWELHDNDATYDYQMKYGVLKTPRMFLTDDHGTIIGRQLTSSALERMLSNKFIAPELEYGSSESHYFYQALFEKDANMTSDQFMEIVNHIEERTLVEKKDTTKYRQMIGDILYYYTETRSEEMMKARLEFVESKILDRPEIWRSEDDQVKVVSLAGFLKDLSLKAPIGDKIPDIKLSGRLKTRWNLNPREFTRSLRSIKSANTVVLFYIDYCMDCMAEKEAVDGYIKKNKRTKVFLVNMTEALEDNPDLVESLDLAVAPFLISYDRSGTVTRKYFTIANR